MKLKIYLLSCCILLLSFKNTTAQNWDIDILKQTNLHRNTNLDGFFTAYSNTITYTTIGTPIALYTIGIIKKNKNLQAAGIDAAMSAGINGVVTVALKHIINRPRPVVTYPNAVMPLENITSYSFPSGHTSAAFNTATILSMECKKWYITIPAFTYASLMGYSRLHEGVHYPSDVITGAIVGAGTAFISYKINKYLQKNKKTSKLYNQFLF